MKKISLLLLPAFLSGWLLTSTAHAQAPGDTTVIQTFTFGSIQNDTFLFPPDTVQFEKILMYYTLKCVPGNNPACGEWDYLTYTRLFDHTGVLDSNLFFQGSFTVNGVTPDSFPYLTSPTWTYTPRMEICRVDTDTMSSTTATFAGGLSFSVVPFTTSLPHGRNQVLYRASELSNAGLIAGDIHSLTLDLVQAGAEVGQARIRIKHTLLDTLDEWQTGGFTEVYHKNTDFTQTGFSEPLTFTQPFTWDGTSNLIIEFCHDMSMTGNLNAFRQEGTILNSAITTSQIDYSLDFEGADYVEVPPAALAAIDSAVTISFWQYGDPAIQPQSDYCFEGYNAAGNRVVNVHLPWGNGSVYWDAGNNGGSYDRINKAANTQDYEGQWNHWAFTKEVRTGEMHIYLNGALWHSGTGKTRDMSGIATFRIGSNAPGTNHYDGKIDEFRIWKRALTATEISDWMFKDIDNSHPYFADLVAEYRFNEGSGNQTADSSPNGWDATLVGQPGWYHVPGCEMVKNPYFPVTRPALQLGQGSFNYRLDTIWVTDSTANAPVTVIVYGDSLNATTPTDTLTVWEADTTMNPDSVLYKQEWGYYGPPFEIVDRYEIGRYITPYGIGLDLGDEGWTWVFDVTDYRPLLADSVHLTAGNWQELLDMKFVMIHGTPPREVLDVKNLWTGSGAYNANIENWLAPRTEYIEPGVATARLKIRNTGHGFGGNLNCAEFCPRTNPIFIDGAQTFTQYLWRNNCGMNPLYPQGGTWIYDRSNWCPGAEVWTDNYELTPYITPGDSLTIDYDMEAGYVWNGQGSTPRYEVEGQLVTYGPLNFTNEATIVDVISPNEWEYHTRFNPICDNPKIAIRNNGSAVLTSVDIAYGPASLTTPLTYSWTGNLASLDTAHIELPSFGNDALLYDSVFTVTLSNPNGQQDEYTPNDQYQTRYTQVPDYDSLVVLGIFSNAAGFETSWSLEDISGNVLYSRQSLPSDTYMTDTFALAPGCYTWTIRDSDHDGLSFFANNDGNGFINLFDGATGNLIRSVNPNFGTAFIHSFTVGQRTGRIERMPNEVFEVFPNPTNGSLQVRFARAGHEQLFLKVEDLMGRELQKINLGLLAEGVVQVDLSEYGSGIYLISLEGETGRSVRKVIVR